MKKAWPWPSWLRTCSYPLNAQQRVFTGCTRPLFKCAYQKIKFPYFSTKTYVVGTQKHNMLKLISKKKNYDFALKYFVYLNLQCKLILLVVSCHGFQEHYQSVKQLKCRSWSCKGCVNTNVSNINWQVQCPILFYTRSGTSTSLFWLVETKKCNIWLCNVTWIPFAVISTLLASKI